MSIGLADIDRLTGGRLGVHDVACFDCGPLRQSARGQRKPTLRIWHEEPNFATYHCARCGVSGAAHDRDHSPSDPKRFAHIRAEAAARDRLHKAARQIKARWLWCQRQPMRGSPAEIYLRGVRSYAGPMPATLGFLPARGHHAPAMIAAFGTATETEPGVIAIADAAVQGVHVTRLQPDGCGKAGTDADKIMIGFCVGSPIVVAPPNDLLGLVITEGLEDALSAHEASGLGAWAAGSASRMPALAAAVPDYIDCVNVFVDEDADGRRHAAELTRRIVSRGIEARAVVAGVTLESAA